MNNRPANPLYKPEFPRSNTYDPDFVMDGQMGPNALWLMEWLTRDVPLEPGMRVLDLACGKGLTSVFLAREFGVTVWAHDLWVPPTEIWRRACEQGVEKLVVPMQGEAHAFPYAEGFFDSVLSVDGYQYFGTDVLYLTYLSRYVRPGGVIAAAMPGLMQDLEQDEIPPHLTTPMTNGCVFWEDECVCFKTAEWWLQHWRRNPSVGQVSVAPLEDGWRHWKDFEDALTAADKLVFPSVSEALEEDGGRYVGFVKAKCVSKQTAGFNLYEPSLLTRVE